LHIDGGGLDSPFVASGSMRTCREAALAGSLASSSGTFLRWLRRLLRFRNG
jgi:hypothetical protein